MRSLLAMVVLLGLGWMGAGCGRGTVKADTKQTVGTSKPPYYLCVDAHGRKHCHYRKKKP